MTGQLEELCAMMMRCGLATGHGDSLREVLLECEMQIKARGGEIVALRKENDAFHDRCSELIAEKITARFEALEEAARVCEGGYTTGSTASTLKAIAAAIRVLKDKP